MEHIQFFYLPLYTMIIKFKFSMIDRLVDLSEYEIMDDDDYGNHYSILNNGYVLIMGDSQYILINIDIFTGIGKIESISHIDNKEELICNILTIKREMALNEIDI